MAHERPKNFDKLKGKMLSPKQRAFVLHYLANGGNAMKACMDAGYTSNPNSAKTLGWTLVHNTANVATEIERLRERAAKHAMADAAYVLRSIKEVADACKVRRYEQEEDGTVVERGVVDSSGALKALELLGKNQRLFVESIDVRMKSELADIPDEELARIVAMAEETGRKAGCGAGEKGTKKAAKKPKKRGE